LLAVLLESTVFKFTISREGDIDHPDIFESNDLAAFWIVYRICSELSSDAFLASLLPWLLAGSLLMCLVQT